VRVGPPCAHHAALEQAPPTKRGPSVHTRFKPFTSYQFTAAQAKACGAHRKGRATHFTSEAQVNKWLANEKRMGRDVGWKDHDYSEHLRA
jgi:hypothetical protein